MDLTKSFPASPRAELFGVAGLHRAIDKGTAKVHGDIGEYHYNCPLDQKVFEFLNIDHEALLAKIKDGSMDDVKAFVKPYIDKKSPAEIASFNTAFYANGPAPGSDGEKYFHELRGQVAPDRTDVTTWPDLLDLDEKRNVPQRVAA